jgi:ATP-dependent Clp protease ATP-binding subunit ClpC
MTSGSGKSFRVYFITHKNRRLTGILMRNWSWIFDEPAPAAYGATEEDVFRQLELLIKEAEVAGKDHPSRYLWTEEFETRTVAVEINPQTVLKKRAVIGKAKIPLRLTYAHSRLENGGHRIMVPRFDWWFILEDLDSAPEVLRSAISGALLGQKPRWIYDFRHEGEEYVRAWEPSFAHGIKSDGAAEAKSAFPVLESVAEDWVERAAKGKLPPLVGLEDREVDRYAPLFKRSAPASILLVGDPGTGKTTFVRRMARLFLSWKRERKGTPVPRIWATSRDRIIAGMIYLGMWQQRCLNLVDELYEEGDYLYVDHLTSLLDAQPDGSSIGELLAPSVQAEAISLIAEASEAELERCRKRHPSLLNAFQIIRFKETDASDMPQLLLQYQAKKASRAVIHPEGMQRLVRHLSMFQKDVRFPGKGFRFLDWLIQDQGAAERTTALYPNDVSVAYSRYSGLPIELISDEYTATADQIAGTLKSRVIGQDIACGVCAELLARFKAGLNDPDKPCGSLFLVGPTGMGKTELAKQLARYLFGKEDRMIRLDMSEYMTPGSAQRMLEVGEGTKSLAERVRQQPLSLVLLDEIEKAHLEVFDLLLGILGEGRLTDSLGRLVDFRMVLIVMTSNLGAVQSGALGFDGLPATDFVRSVRQNFRPEFFNRIDQVISFRRLEREDIERIVDLILDSLSERTGLLRRKLKLRVDPPARRLLARLGYHPTRGARPLKRVIEEKVITPIAVKMARDPEFKNREVPVVIEDSDTFRRLSVLEREDAITLAE